MLNAVRSACAPCDALMISSMSSSIVPVSNFFPLVVNMFVVVDCEVDGRSQESNCQILEKWRMTQNIEIVVSIWHSKPCMPEPKSAINSSFQSNSSHSIFSLKCSSLCLGTFLPLPQLHQPCPMNQEVLASTNPLLHGDV